MGVNEPQGMNPDDTARTAHAERWARQIAQDNGFVTAQLVMRPNGDQELIWGPIIEDMPARTRESTKAVVATYMAIVSDRILRAIDAGDEA